jgi:GTPase SAR1 family protein
VIAIVGNKSDLDKIDVPHEELQKYANGLNAILKYTSAKDGKGVEELFSHIAEQLIQRHQ